jgi:hypothetical protein
VSCGQLGPNSGSDFLFELRTPSRQGALIILRSPIYLWTPGLGGFGTVLENPTFRRACEFQRKEVQRLLSDRREHPIPIRHIEVRILPPQPGIARFREYSSLDEKGPPNAGFSHRQRSPETDVRTFWAEHSQKSPAESRKTPVFWRLALETEE